MADLGIIIQARMGSTRLPQKMIKPFLNGECLLSIILDRLTTNFKIPIILATTTSSADDEIERIAKDYNVKLYRGSEDDVLDRFVKAAEINNISKIIRICADNPFIDVDYIKELVDFEGKDSLDYLSFTLDGNLPVIKNHIGLFAEYTTLNTLNKVSKLTQDKFHHEHVTNFIYGNRQLFNVKLIDTPDFIKDRTDLRFTLDTINDFKLLQQLYSYYLKHEQDIKKLISFVDASPEFSEIMKIEILKHIK